MDAPAGAETRVPQSKKNACAGGNAPLGDPGDITRHLIPTPQACILTGEGRGKAQLKLSLIESPERRTHYNSWPLSYWGNEQGGRMNKESLDELRLRQIKSTAPARSSTHLQLTRKSCRFYLQSMCTVSALLILLRSAKTLVPATSLSHPHYRNSSPASFLTHPLPIIPQHLHTAVQVIALKLTSDHISPPLNTCHPTWSKIRLTVSYETLWDLSAPWPHNLSDLISCQSPPSGPFAVL